MQEITSFAFGDQLDLCREILDISPTYKRVEITVVHVVKQGQVFDFLKSRIFHNDTLANPVV